MFLSRFLEKETVEPGEEVLSINNNEIIILLSNLTPQLIFRVKKNKNCFACVRLCRAERCESPQY
jgi:hypothetical protein